MHLDVFLPGSWNPERKYVIDVMMREFLGIEISFYDSTDDLTVISDGDRRLTMADGLFATSPDKWLTSESNPTRPLRLWPFPEELDRPSHVPAAIPMLYSSPQARGDLITFEDGNIHLGADLCGSAFWLLTRYEELASHTRDDRDRFQARHSLIFGEGLLSLPLVDIYTEALWQLLRKLWPNLSRSPGSYAVRLTCDIDLPFGAYRRNPLKVVRSAAADVITRRDLRLALRRFAAYSSTHRGRPEEDVNNTYDLIMDMSEEFGLHTSFYVQADESRDAAYSLSEPVMIDLLRRIHERGHEIGLHPTYDTYRDEDKMLQELALLRRVCTEAGIDQMEFGGRQHWLRWKNPVTWRIYEAIGLAHDSTLTYEDSHGFRSGTCFDHPVFDLEQRRTLGLRERPLHVMDVTVADFMGQGFDGFVDATISLSETVRAFGGTLNVLWHNNNLISRRQQRLLRMLAERMAP